MRPILSTLALLRMVKVGVFTDTDLVMEFSQYRSATYRPQKIVVYQTLRYRPYTYTQRLFCIQDFTISDNDLRACLDGDLETCWMRCGDGCHRFTTHNVYWVDGRLRETTQHSAQFDHVILNARGPHC